MSEAFVEYDRPAPRDQDRSRSDASIADLRFQHGIDTIESGARNPYGGRISRPKLSERRSDRQNENDAIHRRTTDSAPDRASHSRAIGCRSRYASQAERAQASTARS